MSSSPIDQPDDKILISRIRTGDQDAAELLYEKYASRLTGLAVRQMSPGVRRLAEPEDIVQSAFRSLFRGVNSGAYDAPEGRSLWQLLAVIAIHKVRRKATRDRSVRPVAAIVSGDSAGAAVDAVAPCTAESMEVALKEAMECLRQTERDVVELRVQGYTVEEISQKLNRSRRTVERTLQQIRESLADELLLAGDRNDRSESEQV